MRHSFPGTRYASEPHAPTPQSHTADMARCLAAHRIVAAQRAAEGTAYGAGRTFGATAWKAPDSLAIFRAAFAYAEQVRRNRDVLCDPAAVDWQQVYLAFSAGAGASIDARLGD